MTTITTIAQRILDENNYTVSDISLVKLEYRIDDAIDWVNLHCGLTIADLTGDAGSKSLVGTEGQILVVKWLTNLLIRAYKDKGKSSGISVVQDTAAVLANADQKTIDLILKATERLKDPPYYVGKDTTGLDEDT
jgi:hypothetical protein